MSSSTEPQSGPFPVANSTLSFWRTQPHALENFRSSEDLPESCDILIIGAGFSGVATAYHLLDENPSPPSITILEARSVCSGATGRNGGHVKPDLYFNATGYTRVHGKEAAAEIALFEARQVPAIKAVVEKEKIDCDFNLTRAYDVFPDPELAREIKIEYDQLVADDFPSLGDVSYLQGAAAEALTGVKGVQCAFSSTAASLWPYKLVTHLLSVAFQSGNVNLQTNTPVTSISDTADQDGRWTIETPRGRILAKKVVFATNAYTAGILPQYKEKIIPVRGICSRITVPQGKPAPSIPYSYGLRHNRKGADYQISRPDGSFIVGGGRLAYLDDQEQWYNVHDDSTLIEPAASYFDGFMQRTYRGWEDRDAQVDRIWTGIMGYTNDLLPHVGAVPSKEGQFICAGFNGHGMAFIFLSAKGLSKMLRDGTVYEETGVPLAFKTTEARLNNPVNKVLGC